MMDLVMVNPQELTIVSNVRVAKASADLVASIQEHGLLEPINAYRTDDGALVVKHGHRRTLAAIEAGLDQVPVILTAAPAEDEGGKIDLITASGTRTSSGRTSRPASRPTQSPSWQRSASPPHRSPSACAWTARPSTRPPH